MKKIKVNADLYVGDNKLATVKDIDDKLDNTGDGTKFLSDDGTYKEAANKTDINDAVNDQIKNVGIEESDDGFFIVDKDGNIIFKIDETGLDFVGLSDLKSAKTPYKGLKMITIGDSLSAHDKWQKWLVEWLGVTFDLDENINGKDGHACMSKGGTAVFPNSADSIYMRALDAHYYNPDIIFINAGQNDINHFCGADSINSASLGTIDDIPFLLDKPYTEATDDEKATYTSWYEGRPTIYSGFQGLLQKLLVSNPTSRIIILTGMEMNEPSAQHQKGRPLVAQAWREIGEKYNVQVIDVWNNSGVNKFNSASYYPSGSNVHPTDFGYKRYAEIVYRFL